MPAKHTFKRKEEKKKLPVKHKVVKEKTAPQVEVEEVTVNVVEPSERTNLADQLFEKAAEPQVETVSEEKNHVEPPPQETPITPQPEQQVATEIPLREEKIQVESNNNNDVVVEENNSVRWLLIFIILFLLGLIGGLFYFFLFQGKQPAEKSKSTLKTVAVFTPVPTAVAVQISKDKYTIKVLNGSGVIGEAAKVQTLLTSDGYKVGGIGNADNSNYSQTELQVSSSVDQAYISALEKDLAKNYAVNTSTTPIDPSETVDVVVIVGSKTE
ncbi:MAG TPA: LytR C-terminal domain-containing protein [Patescibacteria group bacterium]|nr:LytR C-terminal domain-containing protein [Patescibacteria group bacterium]